MDSPVSSVTSPVSLRNGSVSAVNIKVAKLGPECGPEINRWLKLKSMDEEDCAAVSSETQRKLKTEIMNGLRELQKENDETAWMYAK